MAGQRTVTKRLKITKTVSRNHMLAYAGNPDDLALQCFGAAWTEMVAAHPEVYASGITVTISAEVDEFTTEPAKCGLMHDGECNVACGD